MPRSSDFIFQLMCVLLWGQGFFQSDHTHPLSFPLIFYPPFCTLCSACTAELRHQGHHRERAWLALTKSLSRTVLPHGAFSPAWDRARRHAVFRFVWKLNFLKQKARPKNIYLLLRRVKLNRHLIKSFDGAASKHCTQGVLLYISEWVVALGSDETFVLVQFVPVGVLVTCYFFHPHSSHET